MILTHSSNTTSPQTCFPTDDIEWIEYSTENIGTIPNNQEIVLDTTSQCDTIYEESEEEPQKVPLFKGKENAHSRRIRKPLPNARPNCLSLRRLVYHRRVYNTRCS